MPTNQVINVSVTGAAGRISYALLFRIANGDLFGKNQSISLQLLDLPEMKKILEAIVMEIEDCAFPLLSNISFTYDPKIAFKDSKVVFLIGAQPRIHGMERRDLLSLNAKIFIEHGKALNEVASRDVKVLIVGNPVNTNAYITMKSAPWLRKENFSGMMRLDHNRMLSQISMKLNKPISSIEKLAIWGNHSLTLYPDFRFIIIDGIPLNEYINLNKLDITILTENIRRRGENIIKLRGLSSAASASNAIINHMNDWIFGTTGKWVSMAIPSDGSYGIPDDIMFSVPVTCSDGLYNRIENLKFDKISQEKINLTLKELIEERDSISNLLN